MQIAIQIQLTADLKRRLVAIAEAGILGRTVDDVAGHFIREALHRDWLAQEVERDRGPPPPVEPPRPAGRPRLPDTIPQVRGKRLLRLREVCGRIGVSRSKLYSMTREGAFPSAKNLGGRTVAWLESDVEAWIDSRAAGIENPK